MPIREMNLRMTAKVAAMKRAVVTARTSGPRFWFAVVSSSMAVERVEWKRVLCSARVYSMPPHSPCSSLVLLRREMYGGAGDGRWEVRGET